MTLVAAYVDGTTTHMIADSYVTADNLKYGNAKKIIKRTFRTPNDHVAGDFLLGSAGEFSTAYTARNFPVPVITKGADPEGVVDRVAAAIQQFGADTTGGVNYHGGSDQVWLFAYANRLFFFVHYDVFEFKPYGAIGAGAAIALGALATLDALTGTERLDGAEALRIASEISEKHSHLVTGPFIVESI